MTQFFARNVFVTRSLSIASLFVFSLAVQATAIAAPLKAFNISSSDTELSNQAVAMADNGNFVVSWSERLTGDILVRRFNPLGQPISDIIKVGNTWSKGNLYASGSPPKIDMDSRGNFVVIWENGLSSGDNFYQSTMKIKARLFDSNNSALGEEFQVNEADDHDAFSYVFRNFAVDMQVNGNFIVAWGTELNDEYGRSTYTIKARHFDKTGIPQGNILSIANGSWQTPDNYGVYAPSIGMASDGSIMASWLADNDQSLYQIKARCFDFNGAPVSEEILIGSDSYSGQSNASKSIKNINDDFVMAWVVNSRDSFLPKAELVNHLSFRRFSRDCKSNNDVVAVASITHGFSFSGANIGMDATGNILLNWSEAWSDDSDKSFENEKSRLYPASGQPKAIKIAKKLSGRSLAMNANGNYVIVGLVYYGSDDQELVFGEVGVTKDPVLTLSKAGTGIGKVISTPVGINCGKRCSKDFPLGTSVTLKAVPTRKNVFAGWGGACTGTTKKCRVTMDASKYVTAIFNSTS